MRFTNTLRVALRALRRNTLRSILTALGIIIGVGAVITMVSIGNGAKSQVEAQVASLGQNLITVFPGSFSSGGMRSGYGCSTTLTPEDAEAIAAEVSDIDGISPEIRDRSQVLANGLNWNTQVNGVGPDYSYVRSWPVVQGTMFSEQEVKSLGKVAVIGKTVADQLFPNEDPLGQTLRIRNLPFTHHRRARAQGLQHHGLGPGRRRRRSRTHRICVAFRAARTSANFRSRPPDREKLDKVKQNVEDLLTQRRTRAVSPTSPSATQQEIADAATQTSKHDDAAAGRNRRECPSSSAASAS
jgi:putative ABC transport system permease protein